MKRTTFFYKIVDVRQVADRNIKTKEFTGDAIKTFIHLHAGKNKIAPEEAAEGLIASKFSPAIPHSEGPVSIVGIGGEENAMDLAFLTKNQPNISLERFKSVKVTVELSEEAVEEEVPAVPAIVSALMQALGGGLASRMADMGRRGEPGQEDEGREPSDPRRR